MLRLAQVAWVLGVNEKTADNAIRTLGLPRPLDLNTACTLALAIRAKHRYGIPLKRGFPLARQAMIGPASRQHDPLIRDLRSYLRDVKARTRSPVMTYEREFRGRPRKDRWGLDLTDNRDRLRASPAQRLQCASEGARTIQLMQGGDGSVNLAAMWRAMVAAEVRFVVIGGVAGNAHGSVRLTGDLGRIKLDRAGSHSGAEIRDLTGARTRRGRTRAQLDGRGPRKTSPTSSAAST